MTSVTECADILQETKFLNPPECTIFSQILAYVPVYFTRLYNDFSPKRTQIEFVQSILLGRGLSGPVKHRIKYSTSKSNPHAIKIG